RAGAPPSVQPNARYLHDAPVLRVDGNTSRGHTFAERIEATASAGDATLFVAVGDAIWSLAQPELVAIPRWRAQPDAPPVVSLHADNARGFLWVVRAGDVLRLDVLDGFREQLRVTTGEVRRAALDVEQGV